MAADRAPLRVVHALTTTPLARAHERSLRVGKTIPWSAFDRARYPAAARELGAAAAESLTSGEYGAVALFGSLAGALARLGAPFDLVSAAARVPADEIRHAEYVARFAALLRDVPVNEISFPLDVDTVAHRTRTTSSFEELDRRMLELPLFGETIAAALLTACYDGATDPVARAVYGNIVRDEVHHARLGWYYFAWRAPMWSAAERQRLADRAGEIIVNAEPTFARGRDAPRPIAAKVKALGVLDTKRQRAAFREVMESEIVPGLDALGLGASHAWKVRRRAPSR